MTSRREQILATAAELFARHGFHGVSVADLGAACGVSGPAIYKHFASKEAVLAEMMVAISEELLAEGGRRVESADGAAPALRELIGWQVDFALTRRALIVVQDRDWQALPAEARERVRTLQLAYVQLWADQLQALDPSLGATEARAAAQATFGLINSTPHSAKLPAPQMRVLLETMAEQALGLDAAGPVGVRRSRRRAPG